MGSEKKKKPLCTADQKSLPLPGNMPEYFLWEMFSKNNRKIANTFSVLQTGNVW
jgi:hypothetical protein